MILDIGLGWLDRAIVWGGVPYPELEEMSDSLPARILNRSQELFLLYTYFQQSQHQPETV